MYIPHTDAERESMLQAIGVKSVAELFHDVPASHRFPKLKFTIRSIRDGSDGRNEGTGQWK